MYFVKKEYLGSVVTMPQEVKTSCAKLASHFVILQASTNQEALEFLYKYNHPGIGKVETKKNDNTKGSS